MNGEIDRPEADGKFHFKSPDHAGLLLELAMLSDNTRNFAADERILAVVEDIVFPGIAIFSSKLMSKQPRMNG